MHAIWWTNTEKNAHIMAKIKATSSFVWSSEWFSYGILKIGYGSVKLIINMGN